MRHPINVSGQPSRNTIPSRLNADCGSTPATVALTGLEPSHARFDLPGPEVIHLSKPDFFRQGLPGATEAEFTRRLVREPADHLARGRPGHRCLRCRATVVAGGLMLPPEGLFDAIPPILKRHGSLFIDDEVVLGFGR